MYKTLHKTFQPKNHCPAHIQTEEQIATDSVGILEDMSHYCRQAAQELLQPRPEVIKELLRLSRQQ